MSALTHLAESNDPEVSLVALRMLATLVSNAEKDPTKFASIKTSAKALQSRVLACEGGAAALSAMSFALDNEAYVYGGQPAEDIAAVLKDFETARAALIALGDQNTAEAATAALKLAHIYAKNVADHPDDPAKRRINATNKALQSRLLSAKGGTELLAAVGFAPEAEAGFACEWVASRIRVPLAVLARASDVWAAEAARTLGSGDSGAEVQAEATEAPAEPVSGIKIRELPPASSLAGRSRAPDLQPALVLGEGGRNVELHCWLAPSKRWHLQGRMAIPSTAFEWAGLRLGGGARGLRIEVDLGDGVPVPLEVVMEAEEQMENEYVCSKRFIDANYEQLNNNWLEEIARKVRTLVTPVLQTVRHLKEAMEAQN